MSYQAIGIRAKVGRLFAISVILSLVVPLVVGCQPKESSGNQIATATATSVPQPSVQVKQVTASPDYSTQVFLWGNAPTTDRDLRLVKDAGFRWIKQMFQWNYIEGKGKGKYEWNEPDRIIKATETYGLKIIARIDFSPTWARPPKSDPNTDGPPTNVQDFADFMGALAKRYKGRIGAYQIWNEPNLARDWGGKRPSAVEYTQLLKAAYKAIKAADPDAIVITAGLSPTTASGDIATPDMEYLSQMYAAGAKDYFDMLGVHAAGYRSAPEVDPGQIAKDSGATNNDPSPENMKRIYAFRHVEDLRQIMVQNGDSGKQVAVLEFGWTSDDRPNSPYKWHAVSEDQKAKYLVGAFQYAKEHWQPWIGVMSLIYISSPQWTPTDEQYYWSITDPKGKVKPAYEALKAMKK